MKKFLVTPEHGRVFRRVDPYTRVLVAIPGDEISVELAEECGLIEKPAPPEKPKAPEKVEEPDPAPKMQSYPTKTHRAV